MEATPAASQGASKRPAPPAHLSKVEADIWRNVVNRLPADWFPQETHEMLAQYCRHASAARKFGAMRRDYEQRSQADFDRDEYEWLLRMHDREGRAMAQLATKMRLTQQSSYSEKHGKGPTGSRPWEE